MADMHEVQFTFQACEDLAAIWDSIAADAGAWHNATAANKSAAGAVSSVAGVSGEAHTTTCSSEAACRRTAA